MDRGVDMVQDMVPDMGSLHLKTMLQPLGLLTLLQEMVCHNLHTHGQGSLHDNPRDNLHGVHHDIHHDASHDARLEILPSYTYISFFSIDNVWLFFVVIHLFFGKKIASPFVLYA